MRSAHAPTKCQRSAITNGDFPMIECCSQLLWPIRYFPFKRDRQWSTWREGLVQRETSHRNIYWEGFGLMEKFMTEVDSSDTATTASVIYCHHHDVGYDLEIFDEIKVNILDKYKCVVCMVEWICYKRKFVTKIFFTGNIEWSSKNLWKMIGICWCKKLIKTTRNKRSGGSIYLTIFYKTYLQNVKYNMKGACSYFSFDFGWYSIHFDDIVSRMMGAHGFLPPKIKGKGFLFLKFGQRGVHEKIAQK